MAVDADIAGKDGGFRLGSGFRPDTLILEGLRRLINLGVAVAPPVDENRGPGWGWLAPITLIVSIALLMVGLSMTAARAGLSWSVPLYWSGLTVILAAPALRIALWRSSSGECLGLVLLVGLALVVVKVLHAPVDFVHFDELLHVATAQTMIARERLFDLNTLLPISGLFPGLEIVTTAISKMTGTSVFVVGTILVACARLIFSAAMFLVFERLTKSSRVAAVACLLYVGNANFSLFHTLFSYETLAMALLMVALLAEHADAAGKRVSMVRTVGLMLPFGLALAVTHHTSATFLAVILLTIAVLETVRRVSAGLMLRAWGLGLVGLVIVVGWSRLTGDPTAGYIGPLIEHGVNELYLFVTGQAGARRLFVSDDGVQQSFLRRAISLGAVLIVLLGLLTGFLKTFTLAGGGGRVRPFLGMIADLFRWENSRLIAITLLTLVFPVSLAFRLTTGGWELGSRLGALSFIGVALVVAVSMLCMRGGRPPRALWRFLVAVAVVIVGLGGVIVGWGVVNLPSGYRVAGDALSIERTGIDAARWTRNGLGAGHRFGADRINRLLLATYGEQRIVTTLLHRVDMSKTLFVPELTASEHYDMRAGRVDYLLVDLRLSLDKPLMGAYFEKGEPGWVSASPPAVDALLKFDGMARVSRNYDNGAIKIYDVRAFRNAN